MQIKNSTNEQCFTAVELPRLARPTQSKLPPVLITVAGNQALIYTTQLVTKLDLPASIFDVAPIFEELVPFWWKTTNSDLVRSIVFGLTTQDHIKGRHLIYPAALPKGVRSRTIIRIVGQGGRNNEKY